MKKIRFIVLISLLISNNVFAQKEDKLSLEEKLYGLSQLWSEAKYNFAFFNQIPQINWDSCYKSYLPKVIESNNDWDYYLILQEFYSILNDGHSAVFPPAMLRRVHYGSAINEIRTKLVDNKVFISEVVSEQAKKDGLIKGMEIIGIDGLDVFEYAQKYVFPIIHSSTVQYKELQVYDLNLLSGSTTKPALIKTKNDKGITQEFAINRHPWLIEKERFKGESLQYKLLDNNIAYLKINYFFGDNFIETFDSLYTQILKSDGLVIDIRGCIGGNSQKGDYILRHFTPKGYKMDNWKTPRYTAALSCWGKGMDWYEVEGDSLFPHQNKEIYSKPINLLVDEGTFSSGENFTSSFLSSKRGKLIGRKTAGSTGEPKMIQLPGGVFAMVYTKRDVMPGGIEYIGYGIKPDIEIKLNIEDILTNRDRVLEKAIEEL